MPGFVVLDHVDRGFQCLVVHVGRERGRVFEPDQDANIEELVFVDAEVTQDGALRGKGERRRAGGEIERGDQFVHARIEQGVGWTIDGVDV